MLRPLVLACLAKDPAARPAMQDVLLRLLGPDASLGAGTAGGWETPAGSPAARMAASTAGRSRSRALLVGAGALGVAVTVALATGAAVWLPPAGTSAAPVITTPAPMGKTPGVPTSGPKTKKPATKKPGTTRPKPIVTRSSSTPKPATSEPAPAKTTAAAGTVRLASLTLDGEMTEKGCYSPSLFPVALVKSSSSKQVEYGYRWIVDGQDEGWETSWVTGTHKNMRNPMGAFPSGKHTVVFRLLTGVKASRSVSFTVCEPYS